jgi:hypothetical protein
MDKNMMAIVLLWDSTKIILGFTRSDYHISNILSEMEKAIKLYEEKGYLIITNIEYVPKPQPQLIVSTPYVDHKIVLQEVETILYHRLVSN